MSQSKYRNKKSTKPHARPNAAPTRSYTSVCCKVAAQKKPVGKTGKDQWNGLGAWRCTGCGLRCRVTVSKVKAEEVPSNVTIA